MEKYYTPNIEELSFGVEIEVKNTVDKFFSESVSIDEWFSTTVHFGVLGSIENLQKLILDKQIRMKFLDKKDIEDCEWEHTGGRMISNSKDYFEKDEGMYGITLRYGYYPDKSPNLHIYRIKEVDDTRHLESLFSGRIKNKTEFKKLINQLGISC